MSELRVAGECSGAAELRVDGDSALDVLGGALRLGSQCERELQVQDKQVVLSLGAAPFRCGEGLADGQRLLEPSRARPTPRPPS